jgi:regulator of sirC expression with transglutaminase-like and TPR domain
MAETYGTVISSFTENVIAGTRLANSTISVNTKLLSTALQQTKDNSKELSRLSINAAKIFSETSNNLSAAGNSR